METFNFTFTEAKLFDSKAFYDKYQNAEFLQHRRNLSKILLRGHELQQTLDAMEPGQTLVIEGMFLQPQVPLVIKKSGRDDDSDIDKDDFTYPRLAGLVAVHALKVSYRSGSHNDFYASDPEELGLVWGNENWQRKLYLSAVSGAEQFVEEFDYFPLLCALRKYQMKKISEELLVKIATIPYFPTEEPLAVRLRRYFGTAKNFCSRFGEDFNLKEVIMTAPPALQQFFKNVN